MSLKEFNKLLSSTFDKMQRESKYLYISGDFNVNIMPHLKGGLSIQEFQNIFSSNFCFPFISKPTSFNNHSASIKNNIYCNVPIQGSDYHAGVLTVSISDHYNIIIIIIIIISLFAHSETMIISIEHSKTHSMYKYNKYIQQLYITV